MGGEWRRRGPSVELVGGGAGNVEGVGGGTEVAGSGHVAGVIK